MSPHGWPETDDPLVLHARIKQLEAELAEQAIRANAAVAAAQDRAYWLDRWHVDLNEVMRRPIAGRIRALLRAVRGPYRLAVSLKRRITR